MIDSLKNLYEILVKDGKDGDILETLGYQIYDIDISQQYYTDKIANLPEGTYFISDLDGTFYRGFTIELTIDYFAKYVESLPISQVDIETYKQFVEDYHYFSKIKQKAYNREIDFILYLDVGIYFLYKYIDKFDYNKFLQYFQNILNIKWIVNPYRFSIAKLIEVIQQGYKFLFVSGSSHFVFDLYLKLLKNYISAIYGQDIANSIYGFGSYSDFDSKRIYNLWSYEQKRNFIKELKQIKNIKVIGGMGDTVADFGIADNIEEGGEFWFVNPDYKVFQTFKEYKKFNIKYHFINERKGFWFEYPIESIKIANNNSLKK